MRYYDFNIRNYSQFVEMLRYIHRNPVKRGLCERPEHWQWSSFRHYATGCEGRVEIESEWGTQTRTSGGKALPRGGTAALKPKSGLSRPPVSFDYDANGRVTKTTFPSTSFETYAYDLIGNLTSKTDRKNQTIQYVYDAINRLTQKSYPDLTNVDYVYDLAGKIKQVSDPTGTYSFAYDNMGRLIGTTTEYSFLPGSPFTNVYTYDAGSNRKSLTAPDGSITTYGYDTLNRLNGMANSWAGSFGFSYDALSRRIQLTRPNGINTNYTYDSVSRLLSVLHQTGSTTIDGASYLYDNAGNRTSKTNYLNNVTEGYTYDPVYQLTQVTQGASTAESYTYDTVGNRLSSASVPTYNYNSSNELMSTSNGSFTYDANGNTLSDPSGKQYSWDFENRLTQVTVPQNGGGSSIVAFKYDPFGRRIQKSGPSGTTNYLYDGISIAQELDSSGSVMARYTQAPSVDEPLAQLRSGETNYYQADGLGSITSLTNPVAATSANHSYDAFGRSVLSSGFNTNPFGYTGRELDSETGMYYYRARYYDATTGRFLTEDPLASLQGDTFYSYVGNRPAIFTDPLGLEEDSPQNLVKRQRINGIAVGYNGSSDWDYNKRKGNFGPKTYKCNKFVYDVATEAGAKPLRHGRPPLAGEWANPHIQIPNWRPLAPDEKPKPGDVAAYPISPCSQNCTGHSGFIVVMPDGTVTNMSAHEDGLVHPLQGQFDGRNVKFRRYIGD